jgi:hypothetical protein
VRDRFVGVLFGVICLPVVWRPSRIGKAEGVKARQTLRRQHGGKRRPLLVGLGLAIVAGTALASVGLITLDRKCCVGAPGQIDEILRVHIPYEFGKEVEFHAASKAS